MKIYGIMTKPIPQSTKAIVLIGILFFIFGFITWTNGTLIPYLKIACELNTFQALLVAFAFYIAYFVTAIPASWILNKTGLKNGMMLGLFVMAIGALLFIPAAMSRTYSIFLTGLFVIGTGLSILQTAVNPYVTIVGPIESAAQRISIMGICNKVAGTLAPIILSSIILKDADVLTAKMLTLDAVSKTQELDLLASRVVIPYVCLAVGLVATGLFVKYSDLPEIDLNAETEDVSTSKSSIWEYPSLIFGVIALFLYVGVEVLAGDAIGTYGTSLNIPLSQSKYFTSYTMVSMVIGYILSIIVIPKYISQSKALSISAIVGMVFSAFVILFSGYTSVLFLALLGFANAVMWPAIWPLAIEGLGKFTKLGSALLIMAIAGGALLPLVWGKLADTSFGHQKAFFILIPCYLFIFWYSQRGFKIKSW
jgi:MFS transporter, FHS family, L-fucose permease